METTQTKPIVIKQYRFDEYLGIFAQSTRYKVEKELEENMGIGLRTLRIYRNATTEDRRDIGIDKLGAAAQVFSKYMEQTITINDMINHLPNG